MGSFCFSVGLRIAAEAFVVGPNAGRARGEKISRIYVEGALPLQNVRDVENDVHTVNRRTREFPPMSVYRQLRQRSVTLDQKEEETYHLSEGELTPLSNLAKKPAFPCPDLKLPRRSSMLEDAPRGCLSHDRYFASQLFCRSLSHIRLVVLLLSSPTNYLRRQEARSSWLRSRFWMTPTFIDNNSWAYAFVVGNPSGSVADQDVVEQQLQAEACHYRDILRVNVHEGYYNLTWKKVEAFKYLIQSKLDFEVVLKTDDDCYLNMQLLLEWIPEVASRSYKRLQATSKGRRVFYGGRCPPVSHPIRNATSKWSVSVEEYNNTDYPAFCFGAGYFISRDLLDAMVALPDLMHRFKLEDVHTGILANNTGLLPPNLGITQVGRVYNFPAGECGWKNEKQYPRLTSGGNFVYRMKLYNAFMNQKECQ